MAAPQPAEVHEPAPATLYKYLPPERIDILENMELRFSRPAEFNDRFDTQFLVPHGQGREASFARIKFHSSVGVLCLAERADNHLMWVNYAAQHTGFVLGFDASAAFFREHGRVLRRVEYREGPKVLQEASVEACFYKSAVWNYENEWRCVRTFSPNEPRVIAIEPTLITQIVFGSQMQPYHIARIMLMTTAHDMTQVQYMRSTISKKTWTFENKAKAVSLCETCGGTGSL